MSPRLTLGPPDAMPAAWAFVCSWTTTTMRSPVTAEPRLAHVTVLAGVERRMEISHLWKHVSSGPRPWRIRQGQRPSCRCS
jgi:hypothetical protein